MSRVILFVVVALAGIGVLSSPALADPVGFTNITNTSGIAANLNPQFEVESSIVSGGTFDGDARFLVRNLAGGIPSFIGQVYVDDDSGLLLSVHGVLATFGLDPSSPSDLPSGGNAAPPFVADYGWDANPPPPTNGIHPGESFLVLFNIAGTTTAADLHNALHSGRLRFGIHVQGINYQGRDFSESYVSGGNGGVPEPASLLLLAFGAAFAVRRKR